MTDDVIDKKQKLLLERLLTNRELFVKCIRITKPEYFEKPLDRVVTFIKDYFSEYNNIAKFDAIEAETGIDMKSREVEPDDYEYVCDELQKFCREQAMMAAVMEGVDHIESGEMGAVEDLVRKALLVKLDNSLGTELFDDVVERIQREDANKDNRKIGIDGIDDILAHIGRSELGIICAPSGGGKSLMLANIGYYLARQQVSSTNKRKLNVLYISLELDEGLYSKRLDSIVTNYDIKEHKQAAQQIEDSLGNLKGSMGSMLVKRMPNGATPSEIRAFIMEYHIQRGYFPDVVMVDYLAGMGVDGKKSLIGENKFDIDKVKSEELREIMCEINAYGFTAAQINREGQDCYSNVGPNHIQGGMSMIQTSDWTIAMVQNQEDIDNNQIKTIELKLRNEAVRRKMHTVYKNPNTLRFTNQPTGQCNKVSQNKLNVQGPKKQQTQQPQKSNKSSKNSDDAAKSKVKNALSKLK